jgi:hypothetical protein
LLLLASLLWLCRLTPPLVLAQLLDLLLCNDNSNNPLEDDYWLASLVAALGQLKLSSVEDLAKVMAA